MRVITAVGNPVGRTIMTRKPYTGPVDDIYDHQFSYSVGFTKPDKPTINPKVDGYRKPSSYACPAIREGVGWNSWPGRNWVPLVYGLEGGSGPTGPGQLEWKFMGRHVTRVPVFSNTPNVNNVRMKVLNNLRSEVLDVAMVLAEIRSTANTLTNGLLRVARSMDAIKKRKPENFFYLLNGRRRDNRRPTDKFLRETAGIYLEWKYGIMPTVYDIRGACKGLDMAAEGSLFDNPPLLVARARDINTDTRNCSMTLAESAGDSRVVSVPVTVRSELKARLDYRVSGDLLRGLNRYGIGLGSVATVLFDKTPFTFVLNMALPIADLIKAWTALAGVDVVGYCETTHVTTTVEAGSYPVTLRGVPLEAKLEEYSDVAWHRNAFGTVPMPVPFIRNPVKVGNLATILALFTQLRKPE